MKEEDFIFIQEYLGGDDKSFDLLVKKYLKPAYNFSYHLCRDEKTAEDSTQDSFLKMWKNLKLYKKHTSFKTWFFTIVRNTTIDYMRKKKNLVFSDFDTEEGNILEDTLSDKSLLPDKVFENKENIIRLGEVIGNLPIFYREVLLLHYMEEMSLEEISIALGRPLNTIKSQHKRALFRLKEAFL